MFARVGKQGNIWNIENHKGFHTNVS
jgi:hypothetical protein